MLYPGPSLPERPTERQRQAHDVAFAAWVAEERDRCARQRAAFRGAFLGPDRVAVVKLMLDRAWALLDANECEACDALLEFVPEADAEKLLSEYFGGDAP